MRRWITASLIALAALGLAAAPACAGPISGSFSGDGTLTPTGTQGLFVLNFTGAGDDTALGPFSVTTRSLIDFSHPPSIIVSGGVLSETFPGGTLFGTSSGTGTATGTGAASFEGDLVFTGGTEFFAGATGEATVTGTIARTSPTTVSVTASYVGSLAAVPEPSSLALLGLGGAALAGWRRWRRKATA